MHEIGVLTKAIDTIEQVAKEHKIEHLTSITLEVGECSGYLPIFFEKYYPIVTEDRLLFKECECKIKVIRAQALCQNCQSLYNVMKHEGKCPKCKSREKKVLSGQDFIVKEISY